VVFDLAQGVNIVAHWVAFAADLRHFKNFREFWAHSYGLKLPTHLFLFTVTTAARLVLLLPLFKAGAAVDRALAKCADDGLLQIGHDHLQADDTVNVAGYLQAL